MNATLQKTCVWFRPMSDTWFRIHNSDAFDLCPPDVSEMDWAEFLQEYKAAENLERVDKPIQIDIELNGGCNMNCPFCLHGYEVIENRSMDDATYGHVIQQAVDMGVKSLKLNYINEPLMRRDLESKIEYAKSQGILNVYFVTNGALLSRKRRTKLRQSGLTKLFISIDATTEETYNRQRRNGLFNKVVSNVEAFINERNDAGQQFPLVLVSFLVNKLNQHEAEAFREKWVGLADIVSFQKMNEVPNHDTGLTVHYDEPDHGCKFPAKQLVVDHLGSIQPCCKMGGKSLKSGNVYTTTLAKAWNGYAELRDMHRENRWQDHPVCAACMRCES